MKIAIDARLYGVENKGIGRYTQELVNNLQTQDKENNYFILLRKKYFNKLKLANNFRMIQTEYRHYSISEQIRLPLLLNKIKPDIFHALNTNVPLIYSGRLVVTVHDMTQLDFNRKATTLPIPFYAIKNLAYRDLFRSSVSKASAIIVPSEFVKADLLDLFGISVNKIVVIPEGVSSQFRKPSQAKRSIGDYLVYVGSSYPHKNLHLLIAAVNMLNKQKKKPIKLKLIVGNDYFSRRLASQVSKEQFSFVEFVSQVTDSNLRLIYRDSLAFVFPWEEKTFSTWTRCIALKGKNNTSAKTSSYRKEKGCGEGDCRPQKPFAYGGGGNRTVQASMASVSYRFSVPTKPIVRIEPMTVERARNPKNS